MDVPSPGLKSFKTDNTGSHAVYTETSIIMNPSYPNPSSAICHLDGSHINTITNNTQRQVLCATGSQDEREVIWC